MVAENSPSVPENKDSFEERLHSFLDQDQFTTVMACYGKAKEAHRFVFREGGERYFEHPRHVALIGIDEVGIRDPDVISALLLHDVFEDSEEFGPHSPDIPFSEKKKTAFVKITDLANEQVAEMVIAVSKAPLDNHEIQSKSDKHRVYIQQLQECTPEALLVKMCDRLHNLRTIRHRSRQKQLEVVGETIDEYFVIFQRAMERYPKETQYLMGEMRKEIAKISQDETDNM